MESSPATPEGAPPAPRPSVWRRLLDQSTVWQRSLAAVVAAVTGVGVLVGAVHTVIPLFERGGSVAYQEGEATVIETQSDTADSFVRRLVNADGTAIMLNHKVLGELPGHGDVKLDYDCDVTPGCAQTRLQIPNENLSTVPGGIVLQGCYTVLKKGTGYGADPADVELRMAGKVCPS